MAKSMQYILALLVVLPTCGRDATSSQLMLRGADQQTADSVADKDDDDDSDDDDDDDDNTKAISGPLKISGSIGVDTVIEPMPSCEAFQFDCPLGKVMISRAADVHCGSNPCTFADSEYCCRSETPSVVALALDRGSAEPSDSIVALPPPEDEHVTTSSTAKPEAAEVIKVEGGMAAVRDAHEELKANLKQQLQLMATLRDLEDDATVQQRIDLRVAKMANETNGSDKFANFLGDMWRDMRMFGTPYYAQDIEAKLERLRSEEKSLQMRLSAAKSSLSSGNVSKSEDSNEKSDAIVAQPVRVSANTTEEPESSAKGAVPTPYPNDMSTMNSPCTPMYTKETAPAVSPTVRCILVLTMQFFLIYTLIRVMSFAYYLVWDGAVAIRMEKVLRRTSDSVIYAPILCVIFLLTRMRAIQLSGGATEKYELPQPWVQNCMYVATGACIIQMLFVFSTSLFSGMKEEDTTGRGGRPEKLTVGKLIETILILFIYFAAALVCYGAYTMNAPAELWGDRPPIMSPAFKGSVIVATAYFTSHFVNKIGEFRGNVLARLYLEFARQATICAPMLCILFVAARMRALQINPKQLSLSPLAEVCILVSSWMLAAQVAVTLTHAVISWFGPGRRDTETLQEEIERTQGGKFERHFRHLSLALVYIAALGLIAAIVFMTSFEGAKLTPAVSPAVKCTICLVVIYIVVHSFDFAGEAMREKNPNSYYWNQLQKVCRGGTDPVSVAPMLCILFISVRMRSLQLKSCIEGGFPITAGPQRWAQKAMGVASFSVTLEVLIAYWATYLKNKRADMPKRGIDGILETLAYMCVGVTYVCVVLVVYALFIMTPENLTPVFE